MLSKKIRRMPLTGGFTLLEILIALLIFTILSMILATALRSVIDAQSGTEKSAERLRQLQFALLIMSRDIEQTINRPVLDVSGKEEPAFVGEERGFTFTHSGYANPARSSLQRVRYEWHDNAFWRLTWPALDQAPTSTPNTRRLLNNVTAAHFEYLDKTGRFQNTWPIEAQSKQPLPRAVKVSLTISQWGTISQLYVVPSQPSQTTEQSSNTGQPN